MSFFYRFSVTSRILGLCLIFFSVFYFAVLPVRASTPSVSSISANGLYIVISFRDPISATSIPDPEDFQVSLNSTSDSISLVQYHDGTIILTVDDEIKRGDSVNVSYIPGDNPLKNQDNIQTPQFIEYPAVATSLITPGEAPYSSVVVGTKLYIINSATSAKSVSVVDTVTDSVIDTIILGHVSQDAVLVGHNLYVPSEEDGRVSVIDTTTDTISTVINTPAPSGSSNFAGVASGYNIYFSDLDGSTIYVINALTNTYTTSISVGQNPAFSTLVGTKLYVNNFGENTVSVIDTMTNTLLETITVGTGPYFSTLVGTKLYVDNAGFGIDSTTLSVIDTETDTVINTISVGHRPNYSIAAGTKLYVAHSNSPVYVVDTLTDTVSHIFSEGFGQGSFALSKDKLFFPDSSTTEVVKVDTKTETIEGTIILKNNVAFLNIVGDTLYANSLGNNTVSAIDIASMSDQIPRLVSFTSSSSSGTYTTSQSINITAHFDFDISEGSSMKLLLNSGAVVVLDTVNGSTLSGAYIVGEEETTPDLAVSSILTASISDAFGRTGTTYEVPSSPGNLVAENSFIRNTIGDVKNISIGSFPYVSVGTNPYQVSAPVTVSAVKYLYVANQGSDTVSVVRVSDNTVVSTIDVGSEPYGLSLASVSGTTYVYVANTGSDTVSVIDTSNNTVIATVAVGVHPYYVATIGTSVYITNGLSNTVSVIDANTNTVSDTIPVGLYPRGIKAHGTDLYVANFGNQNYGGGNSVTVINSLDNTVTKTILLPAEVAGPRGVAVLGSHVYIAGYLSDTIAVIDTVTNTVIDTIAVGAGPRGLLALGSTLYVENFDDSTISLINTTSNELVGTLQTGHSPSGINADGTTLYYSSFQDNRLYAIDTTQAIIPPETSALSAEDGDSEVISENGKTHSTSLAVSFTGSDDSGIDGFECALDDGSFTSCTSPLSYTSLSFGEHVVLVRAVDSDGNIDHTPSSRKWTIASVPGEPINLNIYFDDEDEGAYIFSWDPPLDDGGTSVTDYVIEYKLSADTDWTVFSDSVSTSTRIILSGLDEDAYDVRVSAVNTIGTGTASTPISTITTTVPDAPSIGIATAGEGAASITFTPPSSDGGSAILEYRATSIPEGVTALGGSSPLTVHGLTPGISYTFTVEARNITGWSEPSQESNAVIPTEGGGEDLTPPFLEEVEPIPPFVNTGTPHYTFSSTEEGTIFYDGSCDSEEGEASAGQNTIELSFLDDGEYVDCSLTVMDNAGNESDPLLLSPFTVDTVIPVISSVEVTPAEDSAIIAWTTDEDTSSNVYFGISPDYGDSVTQDISPRVQSHSVLISDLECNTLYHFQIRIADQAGNEVYADDSTFTTSACTEGGGEEGGGGNSSNGSHHHSSGSGSSGFTKLPIAVPLALPSVSVPPVVPPLFLRDLKQGTTGLDVQQLQKYLNSRNFMLAPTGPGSPGNETTFFGILTKLALIRFQEMHENEILLPAKLLRGTGFFGVFTRTYINQTLH